MFECMLSEMSLIMMFDNFIMIGSRCTFLIGLSLCIKFFYCQFLMISFCLDFRRKTQLCGTDVPKDLKKIETRGGKRIS